MAYEDVADVVDAIIHTEGRRYPIPGMDHDDIAQEIRLECLRVIQRYDSGRIGDSPYKFLQVCVRNFLYNMRRGIYVPNNPPCVRCPLWDKINKSCIIDEIGCDRIIKYRESMATKAEIRSPASLECDIETDAPIDAFILDESIKAVLLPEHIRYYELMKAGRSKDVPQGAKNKIRTIIREIIKDA